MFSISNFFHSVEKTLHEFFTRNGGAIQSGISAATAAVGVAASVSSILGEDPKVAASLAKIQDGLAIVAKGVTAESISTDLNGHAAALAGLITDLVASGDIGIKNAQTQAAVGAAANKVKGVIGVLQTAAENAPKAV